MSKTFLEDGDGKILITGSPGNEEVLDIDFEGLSPGDHPIGVRDGSNNLTHLYDNGESGEERRVYFLIVPE